MLVAMESGILSIRKEFCVNLRINIYEVCNFSVLSGGYDEIDAFSYLFSQTKICFSHIAIANGWETEVAVLNPTAKTVTGNLTFYDIDGVQLGGAESITLNAHGRYQVEVGATFAQRGNVDYMIFAAATYGLKRVNWRG